MWGGTCSSEASKIEIQLCPRPPFFFICLVCCVFVNAGLWLFRALGKATLIYRKPRPLQINILPLLLFESNWLAHWKHWPAEKDKTVFKSGYCSISHVKTMMACLAYRTIKYMPGSYVLTGLNSLLRTLRNMHVSTIYGKKTTSQWYVKEISFSVQSLWNGDDDDDDNTNKTRVFQEFIYFHYQVDNLTCFNRSYLWYQPSHGISHHMVSTTII